MGELTFQTNILDKKEGIQVVLWHQEGIHELSSFWKRKEKQALEYVTNEINIKEWENFVENQGIDSDQVITIGKVTIDDGGNIVHDGFLREPDGSEGIIDHPVNF